MKTIKYLSNYKIRDLIHESDRTLVYRGVTKADGQPVVIKLMRNNFPSFNELVKFRNQYTIARNLPIEGIVKPLALERDRNGYALIMQDFGGIYLLEYYHKYLSSNKINVSEFLKVAIQITEIIEQLHQNRIIHKDIKPENILINPQNKQLKIIDFSISTLLPKETQTIQTPNVLEGTLAYISPEQTGRMNRGIDYRSDFYSLGVTLFQMLNKKLPFETTDPMELVHCHLAKIPVFDNTEEIPQVLSQIILKLMAKNAEDRYQSALGLKYDLEKCQREWDQKGDIEYFELGSRDISDRFLIPEKLYGREAEVQKLLAAFVRVASPQEKGVAEGKTELMLVTGFSGIGKTAVVNEVHKPIVRKRGYFIKGKFDQFNRNIPFSALVQSLQDLMGQILSESDTQLQQWKNKILEAVGENGQVIIDVIPELEKIIGKQPAVPELSGSAAQTRFNLLFGNFIQVFRTKEHPLVIFLDDLQWADSASLNLMKLLMREGNDGYLLFIGAYRDNEVSPTHPLIKTLDKIRKSGAIVNKITLKPLSQLNINKLVIDTLKCSDRAGFPLSDLIYQKTEGNPFFATQFLKSLYEDNLIQFNLLEGCWQCDITQIKQRSLSSDVVEFMMFQLRKLPESTQDMLKLAACIGNHFDLETLAIVSEQSPVETASDLWNGLQAGLILPQSDVYKFFIGVEEQIPNPEISENVTYKFLHDRIQQAAYCSIPEEEKQNTHYHIGQLLLEKFSTREKEERLFEIVNHLNVSIALISQAQEREDLAKLNLRAGQKAKTATAYSASIELFNVGIELLGVNCWQESYELSLELHSEITGSCYLNTNFEEMGKWAEVVLQHAQTFLDTINVQQTRILGARAQAKSVDSIEIGLQVLKELGIKFPQQPSQEDIRKAYQTSRRLWSDRPPQSLINLPTMSDPHLLAAMNMLAALVPAAYGFSPNLMLLLIFQQVELSIRSGNSPTSIFGYSRYGLVLCGIMDDIPNGYEFGELALSLLDKFQAKSFKGVCENGVYTFIKHWKDRLSDLTPKLEAAYDASLETGDLESLGNNACTYCNYTYHQGQNLEQVLENIEAYRQTMIQYKLAYCLPFQEIHQQTVLNLLGKAEIPYSLTGEIFHKQTSLSQLQATNQRTALFFYFFNQSILSYLFGKNHEAIQTSAQTADYLDGGTGMFMVPLHFYFDALIQLAQCSQITPPERQSILLKVQQNQEKLHHWATLSPVNHQHRWELVEAERCRVLGNKADAMDAYDKAIAGAKENEYIQDEALANELAAKFYLDWGKEKVAAGYMQEAYYCYARWGAKAKVADLETLYPELLQPILETSGTSADLLSTLMSLTRQTSLVHNNTPQTNTNRSFNRTLDFASILQASQAISGIIQLDELLSQLTQIILHNSGGDRCILIIRNETGEWQVRAIATPDETQLCTEPLNRDRNLSLKLIQYVKSTHETVVIDDLETDLPVVGDYLRQHQPKSVLGLPILNQGRCIGAFFLENRLASGVFTKERITVLNFLCTQAAISIQNSFLYKEWEHSLLKAQKTSQELEETLALSKGQQRILALVAQGLPLSQILEETALCIESQSHHPAYCSFLFIQEGRLRHAAAPSLPAEYCALIDGVVIGPEVGSCGTAAYCKASVTVTDIATDPLWANYLLTLDFGLRACASTPILGAQGQVLATLAMYQPEPGEFTLHDRQLMEVATYLARIAIERHHADIELQQLNLQMIQGEKMATLGNLVAGVAHEVNNPIGFLNGSIENAKDYVQNLFEHLETYQSQHPPNDVVQESAEEIDLEFILEDLPKLLDAMESATDRIKGISTSLRTFSRSDPENKVRANLHEGLDSTLMILKYRLKANDKRPGIEVVKNYGDLPDLDCFPGQLNQVFMNILANAIDVFDEAALNLAYSEIEAQAPRITIKTARLTTKNVVRITIADNGRGMPPEVKERIFDHLFTTKGVGKGTGLGLAIVRQIVVEKHGGTVDCASELGKGTKFIITLPLS